MRLSDLLGGSAEKRELADWAERGYSAPSPPFVKRAVLARYSDPQATWVETGTFKGDTTAYLAERARKVVSIEPEPTLFAAVSERFRNSANVELHEGLSEEVMPKVLAGLSGGQTRFWLDGHYSAGITHKGPVDTPIVEELRLIGEALPRLGKVAVLVDDVRCFDPGNPEYADYPDRRFLVDWATRHGLNWSIEHDIFIARNYR